jgi:hypothetical protein
MPWRAALRQAVTPRALRRTLTAAFVVGTTLFFVNLFGQVHDTRMTPLVAVRIALTYLVPWGNATFGIALGLRDRSG